LFHVYESLKRSWDKTISMKQCASFVSVLFQFYFTCIRRFSYNSLWPQASICVVQNSPRCVDDNGRIVPIGVILGGDGIRTPTFLEWEEGPPLYKYTKSEISLAPPLFRPMLRHWLCRWSFRQKLVASSTTSRRTSPWNASSTGASTSTRTRSRTSRTQRRKNSPSRMVWTRSARRGRSLRSISSRTRRRATWKSGLHLVYLFSV